MREEVISSGTADAVALGISSSPPPTPAASSAGASSAVAAINVASIDWLGNSHGLKTASFPRPPRTSLSIDAGGSAMGSSEASCRPWERGDLLRRLATFKPLNWSGKPKVASSLSCARRGWMNIDKDIIECESCGAHLAFATSSLKPAEVNHAVEAFVEQLDAGHKTNCPWKGNCCADSLAQFPPALPSALIGGYKDRCEGLLQFLSLPVIASSAIETMRLTRSFQIDHFLSQPHSFYSGELSCKADNALGSKVSLEHPFSSHLHAQKLISLCGWEPRWLPSIQDCEENSAESAKNACSVGPAGDDHSRFRGFSKTLASDSVKKEKGKGKTFDDEFKCNMRSPLLDCSLCGSTVRIWDFRTVSRPARFGLNSIDTPNVGKKLVTTRGVSAASGNNCRVPADAIDKEQMEVRDEAATTGEGKTQSNAGMDLNLTMARGLPSTRSSVLAASEHFDDGGMGRDLVIGQPTGSEVGDRAASYESRGPSTRKRSLEEGGSTVDRPLDRIRRADSIEGTVIDRDGDEVDDSVQESDGPSKRARGFDIFDTYHSSRRIDSSGAGPSQSFRFEIDIDVNRVDSYKEDSDVAVGFPSAKDSARASSVIAMDTICSSEEDSMESVENYPGNAGNNRFPSPSMPRNLDMNDALDSNYSNPAQQSSYVQPAGGSIAREMGGSSTIDGEEVVNADTVTVYARDRLSLGISGGSVGMGASHEAEIHGVDISVHRTDSVVGDAEPITEVTENLGQTGESAPGPGLMDEFVPGVREDPHGDSQEMMSRSVGRADSGSKVYGSTKADSAESGQKMSQTLGHYSSAHPSLSCNAAICSAHEASKEEVTQMGKASTADYSYNAANGAGMANGENEFEAEAVEFDPIKHHFNYCPWVNGNVAAGGFNIDGASRQSSSEPLSGWQLTLDALHAFHSLGHAPNQIVQSESAASLYKDDHVTPSQKLLTRHSASRRQGKR